MKRYIKLAVVLLSSVYMAGCSDFLDVDVPDDQLDEGKVFEDDRMAASAMVGVYTKLRSSGFFAGTVSGMGVQLGCYTDELEVTTAQTVEFRFFYENVLTSSNTGVKSLWDNSYQQVFAANSIIENIKSSQKLTEGVRKQLLGEALAIRALLHFYLCQTYGSVPYVTSTDYNINRMIKKQPVQEVMQLAIDDLEEAEQLLSPVYPGTERVRFNQTAVQALLARMYLYTESWVLAKQYAQTVISSAGYALETPDKTFLRESKSAILQLKPGFDGGNTSEAAAYTFNTAPAPNLRLSNHLLEAFELGDNRRTHYVRFVGQDMANAHAFKYKTVGNTAVSAEYSILLRLEEQYLIAAEAAAELGEWDTCNEMLNALRFRVGLEEITVSTKETALNAVLQERRVELLCEFGHRFYDLKRRNHLSDLSIVKANWQPHFSVLPLPESELLLNPNLLPQNNGY